MAEHGEGMQLGASKELPSHDEVSIVLTRGPVTQQAARSRKDDLLHDLRKSVAKYDFLLTGDVRVDIEWIVHERLRYESDKTADVDNIIKPILDAMCGPDGILLDDCQVQSITSSWIDWVSDDQQLIVRIRHDPDEFVRRGAIIFVDLGQNLYISLSTDVPLDYRKRFVEILARAVRFRHESEALGLDFHLARLIMPTQRVFHRSRIRNFRICTLDDYASGRS